MVPRKLLMQGTDLSPIPESEDSSGASPDDGNVWEAKLSSSSDIVQNHLRDSQDIPQITNKSFHLSPTPNNTMLFGDFPSDLEILGWGMETLRSRYHFANNVITKLEQYIKLKEFQIDKQARRLGTLSCAVASHQSGQQTTIEGRDPKDLAGKVAGCISTNVASPMDKNDRARRTLKTKCCQKVKKKVKISKMPKIFQGQNNLTSTNTSGSGPSRLASKSDTVVVATTSRNETERTSLSTFRYDKNKAAWYNKIGSTMRKLTSPSICDQYSIISNTDNHSRNQRKQNTPCIGFQHGDALVPSKLKLTHSNHPQKDVPLAMKFKSYEVTLFPVNDDIDMLS